MLCNIFWQKKIPPPTPKKNWTGLLSDIIKSIQNQGELMYLEKIIITCKNTWSEFIILTS